MNPDRDGRIRILPTHVANKIAAGEVIERPASVVKELVENAIDAGARAIRITLVDGGRKLVSVQDDGCGMAREDALLCLERQATSKIADVDDIERIDTLGFRGEAIPSIASVSRFTLVTRRRDSDEGTRVHVTAGTVDEVSAAGCPPGTLVEVRDLFCNVPARRKFLRTVLTEESHVKNIFTVHALAHPEIAFSLSVNGRELYRLAAADSLRQRLNDLFGDEFPETLVPVEGACGEGGARVRVTGFVEKPNRIVPTRKDQYVFVNGRPATAPAIAYALREAYPRQAGDVRPAAILFFSLPCTSVDVNVHPTKREVRFRDNATVKRALVDALEKSLSPIAAPEPLAAPIPAPARVPIPTPAAAPAAMPAQPAETPLFAPAAPAVPAPVQIEFAVDPSSRDSRPWTWFRFLAQTESGYLLLETDSGLVTLNPQAARERITFEKLLYRDNAKTLSQQLLIPQTVRLSPTDAARVRQAQPVIAGMGFGIEDFGGDTFKIDALPAAIADYPATDILATVARDLSESAGMRRTGEKWREEIVARSIARSFAGQPLVLDAERAGALVEDLASCRTPYVCPRGKPTMIFMSTRELNRKFSRD